MNLVSREKAIDVAIDEYNRGYKEGFEAGKASVSGGGDLISRKAAIEAIKTSRYLVDAMEKIIKLPSAQPERVWHPVEKPPAHHKDVIVRGVEAIGNVTVHKVMQWDVDTWRPTDYAPSIMWTEWSEI